MERKPNLRTLIKEYLPILDLEGNRCLDIISNTVKEDNTIDEIRKIAAMQSRVKTLQEVKNDLMNRLDGRID